MKYFITPYSTPNDEAGVSPSPEFIEKMNALIGDLSQSRKLVTGEGLGPSSLGARLKFSGGNATVTDGPFAEAKELIGGFIIVDVDSKQEAIEITKKCGAIFGDVVMDVRAIV